MPISPKKTKEKALKKSQIISAAEKIFFKNGIGQASMDSVAQEANVSKGTLYLYFKNKNALYRAILRRAFETLKTLLEEYIEKCNGTGKDQVIAAGKAYVHFSKVYPGYFDAILHYENETLNSDKDESESIKSMIAGNQVLEILARSVKEGVDDGSIVSAKLHPLRAALLLWGTVTGVLQMLYSKNELIKHYYNIEEDDVLDDYFNGIINLF